VARIEVHFGKVAARLTRRALGHYLIMKTNFSILTSAVKSVLQSLFSGVESILRLFRNAFRRYPSLGKRRWDANTKLIFHITSPGQSTFLEPTPVQVEAAFDKLDNKVWTGFTLEMKPVGLFQVSGGDRVLVRFSTYTPWIADPDYAAGYLMDPAEHNNYSEIDIQIEDEQTWVPIGETVTKEFAKSVVMHFWQHQAFPEGLMWRGNMGKYGDAA